MEWIIGCSAFYNTNWKGVFYPETMPRSKWFDFYSGQFKSYELNGTFYSFPTVARLKSWYDKTPPGFIFSVKAPKIITHLKKFQDCEQLIGDFYDCCRQGLGAKLGCILFQLPPAIGYAAQTLELITSYLKKDYRNVIEFRNSSWWDEKVYQVLNKADINFCSISYPGLPDKIIYNKDVVYLRLHGNPKLYFSSYGRQELMAILTAIKRLDQIKGVREVYVYFNNTADPAGVLNAQGFKKLVEKETSPRGIP